MVKHFCQQANKSQNGVTITWAKNGGINIAFASQLRISDYNISRIKFASLIRWDIARDIAGWTNLKGSEWDHVLRGWALNCEPRVDIVWRCVCMHMLLALWDFTYLSGSYGEEKWLSDLLRDGGSQTNIHASASYYLLVHVHYMSYTLPQQTHRLVKGLSNFRSHHFDLIGRMAPKKAAWQSSALALSICSAVICLHLGAPKTLPEPQAFFFPMDLVLAMHACTQRLDVCDFVAATSYQTARRVWMPSILSIDRCM